MAISFFIVNANGDAAISPYSLIYVYGEILFIIINCILQLIRRWKWLYLLGTIWSILSVLRHLLVILLVVQLLLVELILRWRNKITRRDLVRHIWILLMLLIVVLRWHLLVLVKGRWTLVKTIIRNLVVISISIHCHLLFMLLLFSGDRMINKCSYNFCECCNFI